VIYELSIEHEMAQEDVAAIFGVTPSLICQRINGPIKRAIEASVLLGEAYADYKADPEASKLLVRWIRL
jgi:hypothetical protein